jgi:plasmid stabilization system protein ParE
MREFVLDPRAEEDLKEAASYYESQTQSLGDDFIDKVHALCERLVVFPQSGSLKTKNVRVARVHRFPYDVFYAVEASRDRIFVLAISHQHRKPGLWKSRL